MTRGLHVVNDAAETPAVDGKAIFLISACHLWRHEMGSAYSCLYSLSVLAVENEIIGGSYHDV